MSVLNEQELTKDQHKMLDILDKMTKMVHSGKVDELLIFGVRKPIGHEGSYCRIGYICNKTNTHIVLNEFRNLLNGNKED